MGKEDVNIKVTANVAEAIRLWKEMSKGPQQMADEMARMGKKGKKANRSIAESVGKSVKQWVAAKIAIGSAGQALRGYIDDLRQMGRESLSAGLKLDTFITKLRIQLNLTDPKEASRITSRALTIGQQLGVPSAVALATQTELASQGFTTDSLRAALESQIATNKGRDPSVAIANVRAQGQFLQAAGLEKNAANLRTLGVNVASLFSDTPLQAEDLEQFALQVTALRSKGFTPNQVLGITGSLAQSLGARRGSTGLRTVVSRLSGARSNKASLRALKTLGLRPEDIDFIGEGPLSVSERLAGAIERTRANKPELLSPALSQLVGLENESALLLFARTDQLRENIAKLGNEENFKSNIEIFRSSRSAVDQRVRNEIEVRKANRTERATISQETDLFEQQIIDNNDFVNKIPVLGFLKRKAQVIAFEAARQAGVSLATARKLGVSHSVGDVTNPLGLRTAAQGAKDAFSEVIAAPFRDDDDQNELKITVNAILTDEHGAERGHVSAVQGANELFSIPIR